MYTMAMQSSTDQSWYNTLVGPSATNGVNNEQYSAWSDTDEIVSPQTGDLTIKQTDIKLPGRNGLDLNISRIYQSNQALWGDRRLAGDGTGYNDYSTYYQNRYDLGLGWAFGFPSVQVEQQGWRKELYYHTGDGSIYHVNFSAGTYSNLENYYAKDAKFDNDTGFSNGQVTSQYSFTTADQTKRYFAADGRLLGVVDRFGNQITFKHTEKPVANYAPNNDFEYPEYLGVWSTEGRSYLQSPFYYDQTFGKDDNTSLKYQGSGEKSAFSSYIPVLPNTKYYLSGYMNNQFTRGWAQLAYRVYDWNYDLIQYGATSPSNQNIWEQLATQTIETNSDARYVQIEFCTFNLPNGTVSGTSWLDKVRFDRAWPLISEITDSIGRKVTFTYNDTLYQDDNTYSAGTITVNVADPSATNNYTLTYDKSRGETAYHWVSYDQYGYLVGWNEQRRYPILISYYNGELYNLYGYTTPLEYFDYHDSYKNDNSGSMYRSLLYCMELRGSETRYDYQMTTKWLGDYGFYETHRISNRFEKNYYDSDYYYIGYQGNYYHRSYSYSGNYNGTVYDNETGYPNNLFKNPNYYFTSTMQQDNGLTIKETYKGNETYKGQLKYKEEKYNNSSGDKEFTYCDEYDPNFLDNVTKIRIEQYNANNNVNILYQGYTYNDWGGMASETTLLTSEQWSDATVKSQHTTSYTYDPTYKFLTSKSYYLKPGLMLTESINYDTLGRIISTTDTKGETTDYQYGDTNHPGNFTRVNVRYSDGRNSATDYNYSGAYFAFPTTVTNYYTEEGVQKTSTTQKSYEFIWGNVASETDALGNVSSYSYDTQGRIKKITHPASTGQSGNYVVEDNFDYARYVEETFFGGQRLLRVRSYKTNNGSTFSDTYNYYDDHGKMLLSKYYDYESTYWIPTVYGYNDYGQLSSLRVIGNVTNYLSDEWGRLQKVTDPQGNYYNFDYDIINRTKTTTFVPVDTGVAENHYIETSDQWGRTISRKGFPDGPSGPTVVEEKYEYDSEGNLTRQTDANNNITLYGYDALNRLNKVTNALGETTDYDYDRLGDLTWIKQYQGTSTFSTVKQYSERGALVSKQPPAGQPTTCKYNANGLPKEVIDASGKSTTMQYYQDNKLAERRANHDRINYYYSPLGGVEKYQPVNDTTGNGEALTYDYYYGTGLVKHRTISGYVVGFIYDDFGNKRNDFYPSGFGTYYSYDNLNRLTSVYDLNTGKSFTYEYYGDGMVKAVNYPQLANGSIIRTEYTYDNINRLKTMKNLVGGQVVTQYSYGYDSNGNITSATENGQTTNYTYDALNRLTGVQRPDGTTISYQYDTRGNRISSSNNMSNTVIPRILSYNNWDQLATFTSSGTAYNYYYDPEGLRCKKVTLSGTTRYHYDNAGRVIAESNESGAFTAETIWGDKALARKVSGNYCYYLYNGHGDVTQVIDQNGNVVDSYTYDEWGNITSKQEQLPQPLKYAGEYYDDESGLYYLRARYYDPSVGRFISQDSVEGSITNPLSLNLYTYVRNTPVIYVDPSGCYLVGLREWITNHEGEVEWDAESRSAVTYLERDGRRYTYQYYIDDYIVEDDHIMVDDAQLLREYNLDGSVDVIGPTDEEILQFAQEMVFTGGLGTLERRGVGSLAGKAAGRALTTPARLVQEGQTAVIGKMSDLNAPGAIGSAEFKVADYLPDMGSPKANWAQNSGILRSIMKVGNPIKDVSPYPMKNAGFLGAERNLLESKGWFYNNGYWYAP
ncbi:hypothetical protein L7E55_14770 [Pelotomaculum isophthalicicum JI]|uniref:Teneurin-like YD-shell domain-containing protein n=1 Tax=Pelotomaculum isophthalicicum JI TaxID=947010 RepID=A0A9X4H7J7_9FIRM|nr:RHS repeat-associated core domain-containing protein [Pelotomaculum isophthalicicum]MDF9409599.1 hypothetical protein [Pelotomaculum isophthalicicum JI]